MLRIFPKGKILKDPSLDVLLGIGNRYLNIIHLRSEISMPIKISVRAKYLPCFEMCVPFKQLLLYLCCEHVVR